tara:strand:+ start:960 stop:1991 length:1032 start_codon:yes stop_codon:yes gene_type:complete
MKYFHIVIFIWAMFGSIHSNAQNTTKDTTLRLVERYDGVKYIAKILSDDGRELLLETEALGKLYILKSEVKRISIIEDLGEIKNGELREESPFSTRYAFTNNALPIKKNEHYAMVNLFGPEIHFAVSNRFNIGVMTSWIASPFILVGKYTIPTKNPKVNFSLASMFGTSGYLDGFESFGGLHWGTFTYGDRKNNISFSGGYGYLNISGNSNLEYVPGTYTYDSFNTANVPTRVRPIPSAPIFSVAGIFQLTSKSSIFFDSMFGSINSSTSSVYDGTYDPVTGSYTTTLTVSDSRGAFIYFMPGMRFQKNENRAFQIAIAGVSVWENGQNFTFPLPTMSWFFKF